MTIEEAIGRIRPLDENAVRAAEERQLSLLKPEGSLGALEALSIQIAGITGQVRNTLKKKVHFLFGSDHGIYEEGVSASPQVFTRALMELYAAPRERGGGINAICRHAGVDLRLFDLGVKGLSPRPGINSDHKLMPEGTKNFAKEPAMSPMTARKAVELGIRLVEEASGEGYRIIGAGEVGMGNTSPAAACIMAALGSQDPALIGRGGGLTDEGLAHKRRVIVEALKRRRPDPDPLDILSCVGGLDIGAMAGVFIGAAAFRVPAVIDGVISIAAALLAERLAPGARAFMIASHRSAEPAYTAAALELKLSPPLELGMRLGEGAGCPIAMQLVDDALAFMNDMATFGEVALDDAWREGLNP